MASKCCACGQNFNELNVEVGNAINTEICKDRHKGPFQIITSSRNFTNEQILSSLEVLKATISNIAPQVTYVLQEFLEAMSPIIDTPDDISPNASDLEMTPTKRITIFQKYRTNRKLATYWSKLKNAFRAVNGHGPDVEYKIDRTSGGDIVIQRHDVTIFIAEKRAYSVRNVYLELFSCDYNVDLWFFRRRQGEFNNENYQSEGISPPDL